MSGRIIAAVFRAELASVIRDRRTIVTSVLVPILLYPLVGLGLGSFASQGIATVRKEAAKICVRGAAVDVAAVNPAFTRPDGPKIELVECPAGSSPSPDVDAIVDVPDGAARALDRGDGVDLDVQFDSSDYRGPRARDRVDDALSGYTKELVKDRLEQKGLPARWARPFHTSAKDVAPPQRSGLFVWAPAIIVFLVLFSILGVFLPAIDLTAGDRERLTLETLLTAPVSSSELIIGKFGVVMAMGMVTTTLNIASLYGTISTFGSAAGGLDLNVALSGHTALILGLASIPTVALSGAICMAIGCLARSFRDAQNYLTPVYLFLLIPAYAAALPGTKISTFSAAVPMLNTPLMLREIFAGTLRPLHAAIVIVVDLLFCAGALVAAGKLYGHEGLAFADAQPVDLLRRPSERAAHFSPGEALAIYAVCTALVVYAGIPVQMHAGAAGVAITELVLILAPPIAWAAWRRIDFRSAFAFRVPSARAAIAAVLFGAGMWLPASLYMAYLQEPVFPLPPGEEEAIRHALGVGHLSLPVLLALGALLPAFCEETLFRGALMQSLLPTWRRGAIVGAALLFAVLHLDPWRFAPTFLLGLVAGLLVYTSGSIVAGMLFHFTNNAIAVVLTAHGGDIAASSATSALPSWAMIGAAACLPIATWILFARHAFPARDASEDSA